MKVYIAAKFEKKEEVRSLYKILSEMGHNITSDWTLHKMIRPYKKNHELAEEYSIEDINGVKDCDVFILLTDEEKSSGAHVELGAAILSNIKSGKPIIYVIGSHTANSMFYFHPSVKRMDNIEEVLSEIKTINKREAC